MIHIKTKRFVSSLLLCGIMALVFPCTPIVSAIDYEAEIAKLEAEIERLKTRQENRDEQIKEYQKDISKQNELYVIIDEKIAALDEKLALYSELITAKQHEIDQKLANLDNLDASITAAADEIAFTESEIARLEQENEQNLKSFGQIVKMLYMTDNIDPVSQLMGATDFFDLLVRTEMLKNVGESNKRFMDDLLHSMDEQNQLIDTLEAKILKLQNEKLRVEEEKLALQAEEADLAIIKSQLDSEVEAERAELWDITANMQSLRGKISSAERLQDENEALQEQASREIANLIRESHRANPDIAVYSSDDFLWPLDAKYQNITTYFGYDAPYNRNHYALDIDGTGAGGIAGAPIYAAQSGTVITAFNDGGNHGGFGNYIVIDHGNNVSTLYAHTETGGVTVTAGQEVARGTVIARVGNTGYSFGHHLHFEVRIDGVRVNPLNYNYENR